MLKHQTKQPSKTAISRSWRSGRQRPGGEKLDIKTSFFSLRAKIIGMYDYSPFEMVPFQGDMLFFYFFLRGGPMCLHPLAVTTRTCWTCVFCQEQLINIFGWQRSSFICYFSFLLFCCQSLKEFSPKVFLKHTHVTSWRFSTVRQDSGGQRWKYFRISVLQVFGVREIPRFPQCPRFSSKKIAGPHFLGLLGIITEKSSLKALFFFWVGGIVGVWAP